MILIFLGSLALAQPSTEAPSAPAPTVDVALEQDLEGIYDQIPGLEDIDAHVTHGVVRLSGEVLEAAHREDAVAIAAERDGVVHVVDDVALTSAVADQLEPTLDAGREKVEGLLARLPLVLIGLAIIVAGWFLASAIRRWEALFRRISKRPLVRSTVANLVRAGVFGVFVLIALELLDATALVGAVLGTAGVLGLAVGFAFQDIVENYLAGILLSLQQPFNKDDVVQINDVSGVVVRLTSRNTLILTFDGNHAYIPNSTVFKGKVVNVSRNPHRRFDFTVGVGVEEDLAEVITTGLETLDAIEGVVADPAPSLQVAELGDSSVIIKVYGWVDQRSHSFQAVRTEAIRRIKEAFEAHGYDLPEPIYRVNLQQPAAKQAPVSRTPSGAAPAVDLRPDDDVVRQARAQREREEGADLLDEDDADEAVAAK